MLVTLLNPGVLCCHAFHQLNSRHQRLNPHCCRWNKLADTVLHYYRLQLSAALSDDPEARIKMGGGPDNAAADKSLMGLGKRLASKHTKDKEYSVEMVSTLAGVTHVSQGPHNVTACVLTGFVGEHGWFRKPAAATCRATECESGCDRVENVLVITLPCPLAFCRRPALLYRSCARHCRPMACRTPTQLPTSWGRAPMAPSPMPTSPWLLPWTS